MIEVIHLVLIPHVQIATTVRSGDTGLLAQLFWRLRWGHQVQDWPGQHTETFFKVKRGHGTREMAQWANALAGRPNDLRSSLTW